MPWPNETMPVLPTSRFSEVANSAIALKRMMKSSKAGLRWNSGIASTTIRAMAAIAMSRSAGRRLMTGVRTGPAAAAAG